MTEQQLQRPQSRCFKECFHELSWTGLPACSIYHLRRGTILCYRNLESYPKDSFSWVYLQTPPACTSGAPDQGYPGNWRGSHAPIPNRGQGEHPLFLPRNRVTLTHPDLSPWFLKMDHLSNWWLLATSSLLTAHPVQRCQFSPVISPPCPFHD